MGDLESLLKQARACRLCAAHLPHGPRPVLRAGASARLLLIGQAPGARVHASGVPWDDRSGDRLRDWLGLDKATFYDAARIAILPMGFCFPGNDAKGGDLPPRPECAPEWHPPILAALPKVDLTLLIGLYAQKRYLGKTAQKSLTDTVLAFKDYGPRFMPLPHPSWRNTAWMKKNPRFEKDVLPVLRKRVRALV